MTRPIQTAVARALSQTTADRALPRARAAVDETRSQLATGLRVQRPSDDPAAFARARTMERLEGRLAQHGRGVGAARTWVDRTQVEVDAIAELFVQAKEAGLRAANAGIYDPEELALQVESLRDEALSRLRAESGGEYLFAGNATATAPLAADGTPAAGDFGGRRTREVAPGVTVALNVTGDDALSVGGVPTLDRFQDMADAIRAGDPAAVAAALDGVDTGADHFVRLGAQTGNVARRLRDAEANLENQAVIAGEGRAAAEEIDLAEVLSAMERRQTALEAALRASAASVQTTILDYLR